jgi:hypothetical protein
MFSSNRSAREWGRRSWTGMRRRRVGLMRRRQSPGTQRSLHRRLALHRYEPRKPMLFFSQQEALKRGAPSWWATPTLLGCHPSAAGPESQRWHAMRLGSLLGGGGRRRWWRAAVEPAALVCRSSRIYPGSVPPCHVAAPSHSLSASKPTGCLLVLLWVLLGTLGVSVCLDTNSRPCLICVSSVSRLQATS